MPFKAWAWECWNHDPEVHWPLRRSLFSLSVEYRECLECGAEYDEEEHLADEHWVRWIWRCACGKKVDWRKDLCPFCSRPWLFDRPDKEDGDPDDIELLDDEEGEEEEDDDPPPPRPADCPGPHAIEVTLVALPWLPGDPTTIQLQPLVTCDDEHVDCVATGGQLRVEVASAARSGFAKATTPEGVELGESIAATPGELVALRCSYEQAGGAPLRLAGESVDLRAIFTLGDEAFEGIATATFPDLHLDAAIAGPGEVHDEAVAYEARITPLELPALPPGSYAWSAGDRLGLGPDDASSGEVTAAVAWVTGVGPDPVLPERLSCWWTSEDGLLAVELHRDVLVQGDPSTCAVQDVWLEVRSGGGRSSSHREAPLTDDGPVVGDDDFHFAPGVDGIDIRYTLEDPAGSRPRLRLELSPADEPDEVLWTRELTVAERAPGETHTIEWDGAVPSASGAFPSGYVTVERSPYRLRIVYPESTDPRAAAYTLFEVQAAGLKLGIVPRDLLTEDHGYLHDQLSIPGSGPEVVVALASNIFGIEDSDMNDQTLAEKYADLWGDGPYVPLQAQVLVLRHDGDPVEAPLGVGRLHVLWDWEWVDEDQGVVGVLAWEYIQAARSANPTAFAGTACHAVHGGKRGGGGTAARLLLETSGLEGAPHLAGQRFPFAAEAPIWRPWAVVSQTWSSGAQAGRTGALARLPRMSGDGATFKAYLQRSPGPEPLGDPTTVGTFRVRRSIRIADYLRKTESVPQLPMAELASDLARGGIIAHGPARNLVLEEGAYVARMGLAIKALQTEDDDPRIVHAVLPAAEQYAGDVAVNMKPHDDWLRDYKGDPRSSGIWELDAEEYRVKAHKWAMKLIDLAYGDALEAAGPGLTVLQFTDSTNLEGELNGTARNWSSSNRNRVGLIMFVPHRITLTHEFGHHLCLPHAPGGDPGPDGANADMHDPGDICLMSYDRGNRFSLCGVCLLRLRGWRYGDE